MAKIVGPGLVPTSLAPTNLVTSLAPEEPRPLIAKPTETFKQSEDSSFEKPFQKPIPHPPKISPSSIPNPNPSVTTNKPVETGYPNYGGYLYSIPGYSAFQPVAYPPVIPPAIPPVPPLRTDPIPGSQEFVPFPSIPKEVEEKPVEPQPTEPPKPQDFEEHFTPEIIPASNSDNKNRTESKMSITSLAQGSGATVTIPSQANKDVKKKQEKFSLKTSIPISKIDMKCVSSEPQSPKKTVFNPAFQDSERPAERTTERTSEQPTEGLTERSAEGPIERTPERPIERTTDRPIDRTPNRPTDRTLERPELPELTIERIPDQPIERISNRSIDRTHERPIDRTPNRPIDRTQERPIDRTSNRPIDRTPERPIEPTPDRPIDRPPQRPIERTPERPIDRTPERPIERTPERPMERTPERPIERTPNRPIDRMPQRPIEQTPNRPIDRTPQRPIEQTPDRPLERKPERPIERKPERPIDRTPERPSERTKERPRVEIQSNIVIKSATSEVQKKEPPPIMPNNSITTLINAAEAISKNEFRAPEPKPDMVRREQPIAPMPLQPPVGIQRQFYHPMSVETKPNFSNKPPEGGYNEPKNQIVFIQNKPLANPKMLVAIQQQNPQVVLQRTNFEPKNLQAPSRLSNQTKKSKEEIVTENRASKVVALKRLHQDDCDENDFENLITENQIYGNKIVVKEKLQGTQQEQNFKTKTKIEKKIQPEPKNVVLQPNIVYLSNLQFPNLVMVKNNPNACQPVDTSKTLSPNENKLAEGTVVNNITIETNPINNKPMITSNKEIHIIKKNNVLQALPINNNKTEVVLSNQKLIMNPQLVYQMPIVVENAPPINIEPINPPQQKESVEPKNDKVLIACPYQVDPKMQPKIVITNLKPKVPTKIEEMSTLDMYERRKRLRRLKYLSNVNKEQKLDVKKPEKASKNVVTPDKMNAEVLKEFSNTKDCVDDDTSDSDSEYGEKEIEEYNSIIEEYGSHNDQAKKAEFLAGFNLGTHQAYKEKQKERHERSLKFDSVATAYMITEDRLSSKKQETENDHQMEWKPYLVDEGGMMENRVTMKIKQTFLSQLCLKQVTHEYKEAYEKSWTLIVKDRKRRYGITETDDKSQPTADTFDTNSQLQLLTQIKKSVNENNNLIKRRLDSNNYENSDIRILAEKNFSELNRLSKMADRSVKLYSGQETKKRDLNPGFDSENIQKPYRIEAVKDYPNLKIPNLTKIISLKTANDFATGKSSQATSMDEPEKSAGGVSEMFTDVASVGRTREVGCQTDDKLEWPGVEAFVKSYREYNAAMTRCVSANQHGFVRGQSTVTALQELHRWMAASDTRKKEISDLHRRNTALRVECAHITRTASCQSDGSRSMINERNMLANDEALLKNSINKLLRAVDFIKNSY